MNETKRMETTMTQINMTATKYENGIAYKFENRGTSYELYVDTIAKEFFNNVILYSNRFSKFTLGGQITGYRNINELANRGKFFRALVALIEDSTSMVN